MDQEVLMNIPSVTLPTRHLTAALSCASNDETRFYLNGVFLQHVDGQIRVVSTDGHKMLVLTSLLEQEPPEWLDKGIIIPRLNKGLAARLALIRSLDEPFGETVKVAYRSGDSRLLLTDLAGECQFRMRPVDGQFPDYQKFLNDLDVFEGRELPDMSSLAFAPTMMTAIGTISKEIGAGKGAVRLHGSPQPKSPALVTFSEVPEAVLIVMPMGQETAVALPAATARLLEGSVKGTLAALRAHRTRWTDQAEKSKSKAAREQAEEKIADYDRRIEEILAKANVPALPAPSLHGYRAAIQAEVGEIVDGIFSDHDLRSAFEQGVAVEQIVTDYQTAIASAKARDDWFEAVREGVAEKLGADDVPLIPAHWFNDGMEIERAVASIVGDPDSRIRELIEGYANAEVDEPEDLATYRAEIKERIVALGASEEEAEQLLAEFDPEPEVERGVSITDTVEEPNEVSRETPVEPAAAGYDETVSRYRKTLKGKKREKEVTRWTADINAALSRDNAGLTVSQLADGVPIEAWFAAGISADRAAVRCLDWRRPAVTVEGEPEGEPEHLQPTDEPPLDGAEDETAEAIAAE